MDSRWSLHRALFNRVLFCFNSLVIASLVSLSLFLGPAGCGGSATSSNDSTSSAGGTTFSVDTAAGFATQTFSGMTSLVSDASQPSLGIASSSGNGVLAGLKLQSLASCHSGESYQEGCVTMAADCTPG